jgi:hypothetical protein
MHALYGRPVFRVDDEVFLWEDVLLDAVQRGRWAAIERHTREALACVAHFEASGTEEPESQIEEAAREFRYQRDLITAQEMEQWLAARELSAREWMDHIRRQVLRSHGEARLERLLARSPAPSDADFAEALRVDFICSGSGWELAERLAERAAAAAAVVVDAGGTASTDDQTVPVPTELPPGMSADRAAELSQRLARIDRAVEQFRLAALTPAAIQKEISSRQMDWIRVHCRAIKFSDEAQAREAALCVREDGASLDDVGAAAHAAVFESRFYLDELEPELQTVFLAAHPVDLLGPIHSEESFTLYRVLSKELPSDQNSEVVGRAEASILSRVLADEFHRRVRWDDGT